MTETLFSLKGRKVFVAGHKGMVGGAILRRLAGEDCEVLTATRAELDLRRQQDTERWMQDRRPDAVFVAAATVGGIVANSTRPGEFLYDNVMIEANVIEAARRTGVAKLLFLGSACVYPRMAPQPMAEEAMLTGLPEPTNEWYSVAKIAGIKLCQAYRRQYGCDFIAANPANLYGIGDRYDPAHGHVVAGMIMRFHAAKKDGLGEVAVWGTGTPRREFLYADDLGDACVFLMNHYSDEMALNVGTGDEVAIGDLARTIARVVGYEGKLAFDTSKPDGAPRKALDSTRMLGLGWRPRTSLEDGLTQAYRWFLDNVSGR